MMMEIYKSRRRLWTQELVKNRSNIHVLISTNDWFVIHSSSNYRVKLESTSNCKEVTNHDIKDNLFGYVCRMTTVVVLKNYAL